MQYGYAVQGAALCCALVGALTGPRQTAAADYSTPDYSCSAEVKPYTASRHITVVYSCSNLSDVSAAKTTVEFGAARRDNLAQSWILGQRGVPALKRWATFSRQVSFPIPSGLPGGTTEMQLTANVNPSRENGEVKTANNITTNSFDVVVTSAPASLPDLTVTALTAPASATAGAALALSDTIRNVSSSTAGGFTVGYYLDGPAGRMTLVNHTMGGLAANGSSLESFNVTLPPSLTANTYTLTVQANTTGSVVESNNGNNTATLNLAVTAASGGGSPPISGATFRSDQGVLLVPTAARPLLHVPFTDPTFGTTITRMTDPSMAPSSPDNTTLGLRHEYARLPALNANNTKMVVQVLGGADRGYYEVRDRVSGSLLYKLAAYRGDPEISWHATAVDQLFYRTNNEIHVFHTDTGQDEILMAFPQYYAITTNEEGRPSDDWRYYAFLGYRDSSYSTADIVVADLVTKKTVVTWANAGSPDWVSMSPSGQYVIAQWVNGQGTRIYDRNTLSYLRTAFSDNAHSDFALNANGEEVLVYQASSGSAINELGCPNPPNGSPIASARLSDGQRTILLGDCNKADWTPVIAGTFLGWDWYTAHFNGLASRAHPGWVLISTYTTPSNTHQPFSREVFWLKLDGSGAVRRLAHHHSDQSSLNGQKDYWAEPHATSSWDGSIVVFSSVWGQPFKEYDLYMVTGQWW